MIQSVEAGKIYVRSISEGIFDAGDEHSNLIFLSKNNVFRSDGRVSIYDVMFGDIVQWGPHMFDTIDTLSTFVVNMQYYIDHDPSVKMKISHDYDYSKVMLGRFSRMRDMYASNAIIRQARFLLESFTKESDGLIFPSNISEYKDDVLLQLREIADLKPFDLPTLTELEEKKRNMESNRTSNIVEVKDMIDDPYEFGNEE